MFQNDIDMYTINHVNVNEPFTYIYKKSSRNGTIKANGISTDFCYETIVLVKKYKF